LFLLDKEIFYKLWKIGLIYSGAIFLSTPAWFFGLLNRKAIDGVNGLPIKFEQTFVAPKSLLDPFSLTSVGPYILLLLILTLCPPTRAMNYRLVLSLGFLASTVLIQIDLFKSLVISIPLINTSLFIWRWTFVTAIIAAVLIAFQLVIPRSKLRGITS
jgi:hypothetical protein